MFRWLTPFVLGAFLLGEVTSQRTGAADEKKPVALEGHDAGIRAVAFLGDGKVLATGSEDKTVKLWSADGKEIATLKGHASGVQALAGTADGKLLASADDGGVVKVWNTETRAEVSTLKGHKGDAAGLVFSPNGKALVIGGGGFDKDANRVWGEVRIWDVTTGKELVMIDWQTNRVSGLAFSPDGTLLATCSNNGSVSLWDAATGKKKSDLGKNPNGASGLSNYAEVFSQDVL